MILSSTATLFWRLFVPVFGTVFFIVAFLAFWLIPEPELYLPFPAIWARLGATALLVGWLFLVYRTVWQLLRVDGDATHLYATNYWTTARYLWEDVAGYTESTRAGRRIGHFHLKGSGSFGNKISFLPASDFNEKIQQTTFQNSFDTNA